MGVALDLGLTVWTMCFTQCTVSVPSLATRWHPCITSPYALTRWQALGICVCLCASAAPPVDVDHVCSRPSMATTAPIKPLDVLRGRPMQALHTRLVPISRPAPTIGIEALQSWRHAGCWVLACCDFTMVSPPMSPSANMSSALQSHHLALAYLRCEAATRIRHAFGLAPLCALYLCCAGVLRRAAATGSAGSLGHEQHRNAARRPRTRATTELPPGRRFVHVYIYTALQSAHCDCSTTPNWRS